ncbi:E3 ubiquitin-protein ligase RNF19A-like [Coregonus clupeaformis]|uniref:E3 ubiquitin-protein ligase RNF19A-like n=1 Tax=Coregonus clupeaformis TaxID=59861 RepID=UPI001E1C4FF7|nr:E3 ubiquitin-protein ligase RNF19A-like [Coregonus clupeaformis]
MTGSLSASGSHVDRMGATRDNLSENASTMALAGASITGSLSGSAMVNYLNSDTRSWSFRLAWREFQDQINYINRLEVQADVQKERCSLSGESATFSLGTISDNASTKAMAGSILHYRDGTSMEVQVDIEPGGKLRYHSGTSRMDDGRHAGRCGWSCPSGCPSEGQDGTTKSKLKKGGGSKTQERREDMDARLLEQHSTNSSEFDSSPQRLSPSVADSHSSHLSEFSGGSDLESMKMSCSCSHGSSSDYQTRFTTVSPLPEVEGDRLETLPSPQGVLSHPHSPTSPCSCLEVSVSPLCLIAEKNINQVCPAKAEWDSTSGGDLPIGELLKENNYNLQAPPPSLLQNSCIQTEI